MTRYRAPIGSTQRRAGSGEGVPKPRMQCGGSCATASRTPIFRFQVPMRDFVADFASHGAKLIIEVDGGQHGDGADRERTRIIEAEGYRVIRFWNNDVLGNPEGVARMIEAVLVSESTPTPALPHQGGGSHAEPSSWRV